MTNNDQTGTVAAEDFLAESDDAESALQAALAADDASDTWTFDDIGVDSGRFGELVSRDIVEKVDGEYRLADPDAIRELLADEETQPGAVDSNSTTPSFSFPELTIDTIDYRALTGLVVSLAIVAGARMLGYARVFQNGYAISPANDPYYFRYWLDQVLATSDGLTDIGVLNGGIFESIRPFTHATNWFLAELLGGGEWAATTVAIWTPVVAAVVLGAVLYQTAIILTRDARIGIATVLVYALTPINVGYTSLGFFDHNYNQYLWLGVTLLTVSWLAVAVRCRVGTQTDGAELSTYLRAPRTWVVAVACGLSIAFGTHAWGGSPLLLIPLAVYIALRVPLDVRAGLQPARTMAPIVCALLIGGVVSYAVHTAWGWHQSFVALTPALLAGGAIGVTAIGEVWWRRSMRVDLLLPAETAVASAGSYVYVFHSIENQDLIIARINDLLFREAATETASLFTSGFVVGAVFRFGIPFFIAIIALVWVGVQVWRTYEPAWLLIATYATVLTSIAAIQTRFAGQLTLPISLLAGVGVVYLLTTVDLIRTPSLFATTESQATATPVVESNTQLQPTIGVPDRETIALICVVGLVLFSVSAISVSGTTTDIIYDAAHGDALAAVDAHSTQFDREYPDNYVLNRWGHNRMFNYHVNGESEGYGYARNNYESFISATNGESQYEQLSGRVGYVVVSSANGNVRNQMMQGRLLTYLNDSVSDPPSHYQLLYIADDRSLAAYALVPGARLVGETAPNTPVTLNTSMTVNSHSFSYEWTVTTGEDGRYAVTTPYPGQYRVGGTTVEVPSSAVMNGTQVTVGEHAIN